MEIATYGDAKTHEELVARLRDRGLGEPIARVEELSAAERRSIRVIFGWRIPQEIIDTCPQLAWIQGAGAGVEWLLPLTLPETVTVTRIIDQFGPDMGEFALLATLAWVKDLKRLYDQQRRHRWSPYLVGRLRDLKVGILGSGSIGAHLARMYAPLVQEVRALGRRRPNLGYRVRGYSIDQWEDFYRALNVVVLVLPHTPATYHLVSDPQLSLMAPGSYLINLGRGAVLDSDALIRSIQSGHLGGAFLDVVETEPLPQDSPLWDLEHVTISPHVSGPSRRDGMAAVFYENLMRFRRHQPLVGVVNRERGY